ncbi:U-box domain-containing protein 21 [Platanthera guangdongensis]|uniref:U-box domain-containing protein n=1 Tax=Platanthera guangdongensis TaxID=2320717 RepID=A0ABR2N490_9ASPA
MAFSRKKLRASLKSIPRAASLPVLTDPPVPDHFRCPISLDIMKDPVTAPTGITYDRQCIEKWLDMGNSTCPVTNTALAYDDLIPNHTMRRLIQTWFSVHRSNGIDRIPTPRIPISQFEALEILSDISSVGSLRDVERCRELAGRVASSVKGCERNRRTFLSTGALPVLASAFRASSNDPIAVSVEILAALSGLLPFDDEITLRELGSPESLDSIMRIMTCSDISNRLNAVLMVKKMALETEDLVKALAEKNGLIEALTELIREPISKQAAKASLSAMFHLISCSVTIANKCADLGLIPLLLEILVDSDKSMAEKALASLDAMCDGERGRETACGNALTIPLLAKKMFRVSNTATESTVSTLWKLCEKCRGRCLVECLQAGVLQKLLLLLQAGCSESTKRKATKMLKLLSRYKGKLECVDTVDFKGLNRLC